MFVEWEGMRRRGRRRMAERDLAKPRFGVREVEGAGKEGVQGGRRREFKKSKCLAVTLMII